jgi:hypothetical protein
MFPEVWELQKIIFVPTEINISAVRAQNVDLGGLKIKTLSANV